MGEHKWFLFSMALMLSYVVMLVGFAMGQQSYHNQCQNFGMFHHVGTTYSCQQVKSDDVVVTDFREVVK